MYFTQCYLMLKASCNGFELCIFPHVTLPPWKQLWQTVMKNPNRKLNYSNADSWLVSLPLPLFPPFYLQNNRATPGSAEQRLKCNTRASIKSTADKSVNFTAEGIYMLKGHNLTAVSWKCRWTWAWGCLFSFSTLGVQSLTYQQNMNKLPPVDT